MPALKLTAAASFAAKPYKWARTAAVTTVSSSASTLSTAFAAPHAPPLALSLSVTNNRNWRTITPCAHLPFCDCSFISNSNSYPLGFGVRGQKIPFPISPFCRNSSSSSSSPHKAGVLSGSDSPPSGSGLVADMGPENKVDGGVDWVDNGAHSCQNQPPPPLAPNHHHHNQNSKLLTLPTVLTLGRVAAVPLLICTFYVDSWWGRTATTSIFIAAAVTDWLDGYLARKMRLGSAFGAFLDPVADKLMVAATLVLLCTRPFEVATFGQVQWLLTVPSIAIIGREITMSAVREWAASQNAKLLEAVAVNNLGKWKTATQMTALTILLATRDSVGGPGILVASGVALLYISAGLSVWSFAVYMSKIWRVLLK